MKKVLISLAVVSLAGATNASADDFKHEHTLTSGLSSVSAQALETLDRCLNGPEGSSKAIHACTRSLRNSVPNSEVRSDIYTQRALHYLSSGRFERASRDFKSASKLNTENEYARLGQGFAALMANDGTEAAKHFNACDGDKATAPLAAYGRAMVKEMSGDVTGAMADYIYAAELRPEWQAPREEIRRIKK